MNAQPTTWESCAEAGMTQSEAARAMGRKPMHAHRYALKHGLKFAKFVPPSQKLGAHIDLPIGDAEFDSTAPAQNCANLWLAVLLEEIRTVLNERVADRHADRARARNWFGSPDFEVVCLMAGLEPEYVLGVVNARSGSLRLGGGAQNSSANTSAAVMQQRSEPHDSLDDFPTPPWATRSLCEKLLSHGEPLRAQTAWDPCCNRGYMAKPAAEYFKSVYASDVHDYGWEGQDAVADFLIDGVADAPSVDWVVMNFPFRLGQEFIERGLEVARRGVAVFARTAFVEGQTRYEQLFRDHPESLFMPFVERVVLWKGVLLDPDVKIWRWNEKKGKFVNEKPTSATSYCWLVFTHDRPKFGKVDRIGIVRKSLTRAGDYPELPEKFKRPTELGALL